MASPSSLSQPRLLVIADDLTGANDTGVQFAKKGISTFVFPTPEFHEFPPDFEVVVVNTESRHLSAQRAGALVSDVALKGRKAGIQFFYKKTDSTLRGNLGCELEALLCATGLDALPFVPAFPELGRTTKDGIHYVHGEPLANTVYAQDPLNPVRESSVAGVLRVQSKLPTQSVSVRSNSGQPGNGFWVYDCESTDDLRLIGAQLRQFNRLTTLAGSAALANELPELITFNRSASATCRPKGPVLIINGSVNERALAQIRHQSLDTFNRVRMPPELLVPDSNTTSELLREVAVRVASQPSENALLYSIASRGEMESFHVFGQNLGLNNHELHLRIAESTGKILAQIIAAGVFKTLVVFGGDTLTGIARACGWPGFIPLTEAGPGLTVATPAGTELTLISKAGGFGELNVMETILNFVQTSK